MRRIETFKKIKKLLDNPRTTAEDLAEVVAKDQALAGRLAEILDMEPDEVFSKGRQNRKVSARSLLCFWAARELGMSHTFLAKRLEMSPAGVGFSVERGESIAKKGNYLLRN